MGEGGQSLKSLEGVGLERLEWEVGKGGESEADKGRDAQEGKESWTRGEQMGE